jgi:hypothetical protein
MRFNSRNEGSNASDDVASVSARPRFWVQGLWFRVCKP